MANIPIAEITGAIAPTKAAPPTPKASWFEKPLPHLCF